MLIVTCPYCGPRPEIEFRYGGEAHVARPEPPSQVSDEVWAAYLFYRNNPIGLHAERWLHVHGCGRWFNARRNTLSDRFIATYEMGDTEARDAST
jgi:sarcosine oxidase subunit delta